MWNQDVQEGINECFLVGREKNSVQMFDRTCLGQSSKHLLYIRDRGRKSNLPVWVNWIHTSEDMLISKLLLSCLLQDDRKHVSSVLALFLLSQVVQLTGLYLICLEGRPGLPDVSPPPVWNLRAVIWFHFTISSPVLLPSPVTLFGFLFLFLPAVPILSFFQVQYFLLRGRLFCMAPFLAARRSKLVNGMCSRLPYGTCVCCFAFV